MIQLTLQYERHETLFIYLFLLESIELPLVTESKAGDIPLLQEWGGH